ncbi:MAG TPA: response regulator [Steroidobacteraceae bacterium]|nr:response regulator [Steroidobacteraceae bacterium]
MSAAAHVPESAIRILVVDDNPAALYATARVLRSAGFEVLTATTGNGALASAAGVDLVVLDVNLPDVDGFEVCRRLRAQPETARLPVLHLSATFTQAADLSVGLEAGADGYLTRPVEPPVLIATVRTLLFARRADSLRAGLDARLRAMFELAPTGMAILDARLQYESVNAAYCELVGCSAEALLRRPFAAGSGAGWGALMERAAARLAEEGRWQGEGSLTLPDGTQRNIDWRVARVTMTGAYFVIATDMTERLRQESEREQLLESERAARADAERGNRLKEEFLATLSHELRNPLNAILGWANVLAVTPNLSPKVAEAVEAIQRNGKLQASMIGDLLDYASTTFGKMRLVLAPLDPYPAVRAAIEVMRAAAQANGVELTARFAPERLQVQADAERLQQIVWNLLSNAIKFSRKGTAVTVSAGRRDGQFHLTVHDHGRGIDPEFLPRVFERFSQADGTTTRRHGGLGIGLALVKQLVQMHGGTIAAASEGEGKGATFTLELPLIETDAAGEPSESQRLSALDLSAAVVLLVEDDPDARELTRRILSDLGAKVVEASNARAALAAVQESGVNFFVSDIGMAEQDGYQLLRELRARGYDAARLPAIALTAFARAEDRDKALAAGFQDHLVKPVEPQVLVARIAALLPRRR